ncbi:alpha/beta hydrolase [Algibacter mikhailovii]|uniref:Phosphonate ABC transporter ATP-binding protein n=1 Tax=Algibacter mikhailovii TaxID=425498 RepID=A0A918V8P6_9FLAO|nr:alpha/beta hydrolase-fold protein [Algibacter mikhailovii]GGZ80139.1 phosphonate ABC transporter ATP-binding protein [Algibacter mikhailovii]
MITILICCKDNRKGDDNAVLGEEVVTFVIDALPENHSYDDHLYLSGNFEGWSGGREQFKLKQVGKQYYISIPKYKELFTFKFTKGNWETVECALNGNPIDNRFYAFNKLKDTVKVNIAQWQDSSTHKKVSTASKNVQVFDANFEFPQLNRQGKISVYLPSKYDEVNTRYPVLYMLDGQNVFDESTSYSGEWKVDETLNRIHEETDFNVIVVAIDHGGDKRFSEYSAWDNDAFGKGRAASFLQFLVETLKPKIDAAFRTQIDVQNTAIMGASLGGLFAHYAAFKAPDVFGKAGVFSPSFWSVGACYDFTKKHSDIPNTRLYYLIGGNEGQEHVENMTKMVQLIKSTGFPEQNIIEKIAPNGTHSESFWSAEFEDAIKWLFKVE